MSRCSAIGSASPPIIEVRTRFYDEALKAAAAAGARQFVLLAAGRDARAYRIGWPSGVTVFEVDQPGVITAKDDVLVGETPLCRRVSVGCDRADDWPAELRSRGFNAGTPTVWLVEGRPRPRHWMWRVCRAVTSSPRPRGSSRAANP